MKLSYEWLKEYVDIGAGPEAIAEKLTMSGSEVESIQAIGDDRVMILEITSNRPDCLNIVGLAREVSAVFDRDLRVPDMTIPDNMAPGAGPRVKCIVKSRKLCPRYTARVITGVNVTGVSEKIKKRILALGLRGVNNVVDITNFCLMETGQPLHAFDLDKIKNGKICVREAVRGEKIVTIDNIERELSPGMLVIADGEKVIAVAGVMGGKDTEVTEQTRNILLESALFDPASVRKTARLLGLSSDSSYRFERGVDRSMIAAASDRAAVLIAGETGGNICGFYDIGDPVPADSSVRFSIKRAEKTLGIPLDRKKVYNILNRLGITVSASDEGEDVVTAVIPAFREDLRQEIDLVEEVARIYGYNNIPETVPKFVPGIQRKEHLRMAEEKLRKILAAAGLHEIMTYSLISHSAVGKFPDLTDSPVVLNNPLSAEQSVLTPHLLDGMLKTIERNMNRKNNDLKLFEIGKIYSKPQGSKLKKKSSAGDIYRETPALCIGLTGALRRNWQEGVYPAGLFDLKGIVETVLSRLKVQAEFETRSMNGFVSCAEIKLPEENTAIGFIGKVGAGLLGEYDISQSVYVCQLELNRLLKKAVLENRYHAVPRFPASSRDISILCGKSLPAAEIQKIITTTGEEIIREIELVDIYEGAQVPAGKRSLTYSIRYGLSTRTLTEEEIEAVHTNIKETLMKQLKITFR